MRGNRIRSLITLRRRGSIPAYAGEPPRQPPRRRTLQVYPRVCGGTPYPAVKCRRASGLSPRMRGNQLRGGFDGVKIGSIPAYAGEPQEVSNVLSLYTVYPRVCGGTQAAAAAVAS